jgi:hypothetical protein
LLLMHLAAVCIRRTSPIVIEAEFCRVISECRDQTSTGDFPIKFSKEFVPALLSDIAGT